MFSYAPSAKPFLVTLSLISLSVPALDFYISCVAIKKNTILYNMRNLEKNANIVFISMYDNLLMLIFYCFVLIDSINILAIYKFYRMNLISLNMSNSFIIL